MRQSWWKLPGPSRFVGRIADALRDGSNVIIGLPKHYCAGLEQAVRNEIGENDGWVWRNLDFADSDISSASKPVSFLWNNLFPDDGHNDCLRDLRSLMNSERFEGRIIWLRNISTNLWSEWKQFFEEYSHSCSSRSLISRTLFCVPAEGIESALLPAEDVCLSHVKMLAESSSLDMLLYVTNLIGKEKPNLLTELTIAAVAKLSLWDPQLADYLTSFEPERIMNPIEILGSFAESRGWTIEDGGEEDAESLWRKGIVNRFDGSFRCHSALMALKREEREVYRRIWSAQVSVLYPFVEENRQAVIERLAKRLKIPYSTRFGVITDIRDLEIGHIFNQLEYIAVDNQLRSFVEQLKNIRDDLSHLKPITDLKKYRLLNGGF